MKRNHRRRVFMAAAAVCGFVLLLAGVGWYTLRTNWLKDRVREKIVATIQNASGGDVELGSFRYDWRSRTAELKNLVIYGSEPRGGSPFFRSDSVHIRLKLTSLLRRNFDIGSITVDHPEIDLLIRPDGSTNIPGPKFRSRASGIIQQLLSLKVEHFELNHGTIQAGAHRIPLTARGADLRAVLNYDAAGNRYAFDVSSRKLHMHSGNFPALAADVHARGEIAKDQVLFQHIALRSGTSTLEANGALLHFASPEVDVNIKAQVSVADFASIAKLPELRGGELMLSGRAHYNPSTPLTLYANIAGHNLTYRFHSFTFSGGELASRVDGTPRALRFTGLSLSASSNRLDGEATITNFRDARLDGRITALNIRELGRLYTGRPLAWSGIASGPVHLSATLDRNAPNLTAEAELAISRASGGIPVSGDIGVVYRERGGVLNVEHSHFDFPHTHLALSGTPGSSLQVVLDSTNFDDLQPALAIAKSTTAFASLPFTLANGSLHFDGTVTGSLKNPNVQGTVELTRFRMRQQIWDKLQSEIQLSPSDLSFNSLTVQRGTLHATGNGRIGLANWSLRDNCPLAVDARFLGADVSNTFAELWRVRLPIGHGIAAGAFHVEGSLNAPSGHARLTIDDLDASGERLNRIDIACVLARDRLQITSGRMQAGPALVSFSGAYEHVHGAWREGIFHLKLDSNGFPLASLSLVRQYNPRFNAQFEVHGQATLRVNGYRIEPAGAAGTMVFRSIRVGPLNYGDISVRAASQDKILNAVLSGDLRGTQFHGAARVQLIPGTPVTGEINLDHIDLATVRTLMDPGSPTLLPVRGFLEGALDFTGSLEQPAELKSTLRVKQMELLPLIPSEMKGVANARDLVFRNSIPFVIDASNGLAKIHDLQIVGKDTRLALNGSIPYSSNGTINLRADGALDLRIFELFDPRAQSSGESQIQALISGPLNSPSLTGTLGIENGSFSLTGIPNGVTGVNGTLRFDHDRATIQTLTAHTGGGDLSLAGFVSFAGGGPLVYRLEANASNVRLRYVSGISVSANSALRLTGTSKSSLLSGTVSVSQITLNPSTDLGTLMTRGLAPTPQPATAGSFLNGVQLNIHVQSAPGLILNTALSQDVQADVDLRVRGTPARPVVLGNISANQGDIKVFGAKYSINRGQVSFTNPINIEPVFDLDLQTQARGITVDITISGTLNKLNINYRSDPPLQPRDIVALLTVGRAPNVASNFSNLRPANDVGALQSGANTVLGQAISPSSNRLSKLFGIANIKIDPLVQGITNTQQARLTVEQQMSRDITITYVTNLSQTSEQIFRFEWALSRQYSVVALRDDNGEFGIDIQYKKRFK